MAISVYLLTVTKRKNSTLQPTTSGLTPVDVVLKTPTSEDAPSFLLSWSGAFSHNYLVWGSHYYWIDSVSYERNDLVRIDCSLDVLATYKSYITGSTQYVLYSSVSGGTWLPDPRMAILSDCTMDYDEKLPTIMWQHGEYILSVLGTNGCKSYITNQVNINKLLQDVQTANAALKTSLMNDWDYDGFDGADSVGAALKSMTDILTQTDLLGNAYQNAVSCIRSCIWVPFSAKNQDPIEDIWLGNYHTTAQGAPINAPIWEETVTLTIPWQYTDWRRVSCESMYLYLPLVGTISLNTAELVGLSQITIICSFGITDGTVAYQILAGSNIIGSYGGNCSAQYAIGINQQASAGQIANSMIAGIQKVAGGLTLGSIPSVNSVANAVMAVWDVGNTAFSTNPTVIGGIGGGAAGKLDLHVRLTSIAHNTVVTPADMGATMGLPTQKPIILSGCTGFCQCANAHVAAPAHGDQLNAIDMFLNSGFYIE